MLRQVLLLDENALSHQSSDAVGKLLQIFPCLEELALASNSLESEGITVLCQNLTVSLHACAYPDHALQ